MGQYRKGRLVNFFVDKTTKKKWGLACLFFFVVLFVSFLFKVNEPALFC